MAVYEFDAVSNDSIREDYDFAVFDSYKRSADCDNPILIIDNSAGKLSHHSYGMFLSPIKGAAFEYQSDGDTLRADIIKVDSRFVSLIKWLGENHIEVLLSGRGSDEGYFVYKIRETHVNVRGTKLSAQDGFLQFMIARLFASDPPGIEPDIEEEIEGDGMKLTSLQSITDFLTCAGRTLPDNINQWARRNLTVAKSAEVTVEERRHAQRALSMMLSINWKNNYFESIDPIEARRILDEELFGMDKVKQRIIETIIQINRTHTLPAYGLLLIGPAGTGKSQIAYAVARILRMPWAILEMSSINDPEQLTGSSRIYSNAKPGIIMESFASAESSNLVFIINELDKAASGKGNANPADVLLTLLDNLGFTDNYIECNIPTGGVYPIATANDKSKISAPLMSRFAVIELPDYTIEEKKVIFTEYALPKVLKRIGLMKHECIISDDALDEIMDIYRDTSGIRDIEQAAEHIVANALYLIEAQGKEQVVYDAVMVRELLN